MTGDFLKLNVFRRPGRLLRNTMHASGWNVARIALQAGSLILLTRTFGVQTYGVLAGATSLYITIAQFVGLGSGVALVRHISQHGRSPSRMRATQQIYLLTGVMALLVAWPISLLILGGMASPLALACLATAELLIAPTLIPYAYLFQAEERLFLSGAMQTLAPIARIVAVVASLLAGVRDLGTYAIFHLSAIAITVATATLMARRKHSQHMERHSPLSTICEGLPYMVSSATITASGELDKTILLRVQDSTVTGVYTAAYRIMQAATLPVNSLILAAMPRLFRNKLAGGTSLAKSLLVAVLAYSLMAAAGVALLSPFLHLVLGEAFTPSEPILRAFCCNIVTGCVRQLITARLTASDKQGDRNVVEIAGLVTSVVLLALLTPSFGPWGAIVALATSDVVVIGLGGRYLRATPRLRHAGPSNDL